MKEYLRGLASIIKNSCDDISELEKRYINDKNRDQIKTITALYTSVLKSALTLENELTRLVDKTPSKKLVLDEDPTSIRTRVIKLDNDPIILDDSNTAGDIHVLSLDEDPLILQTREGKKIVLDEDPVCLINREGKKIFFDDDPIEMMNGIRKLILDEDPALIKLESGKKIVLDEDPLVISRLKENDEVMDEYFSYSGNNIVFDDDIYVVNVDGNDKKNLILDKKPGLFLNDMANRISVNEEESKDKGIHTLILDEDPTSIVLADGKSIVLDEDPEVLKMKVNGHEIVLDEDPEILSKNIHKTIVLEEDPISIELQ